jgi:hypothetical protein
MIKKTLYILTFLSSLGLNAQEKQFIKEEKPKYDRKEEVIYDNKRYRINNNYLTLGGGFLNSNLREQSQKTVGIDFQFHIKRQHFQAGVMMSGPNFNDNNNVQGHFGYGYRRETKTSNLAVFAGPTYFTGVLTISDSLGIRPEFYEGWGGYVCAQGIAKLTYDFGIGAELFAEFSKKQTMFGFKIIAFFSGAYRGPKRNYNPNVRSENPK